MRQIIVILVLIVFAFALSGCDKIKAELERRHLGAETQKETSNLKRQPTSNEITTYNVKRPGNEASAARRQVVIRIDLPIDEKIQIRLVKNTASKEEPIEESKTDSVTPPNEVLNEAAPPKAERSGDNPENSVESEKKAPMEQEEVKDGEPKTEIKSDSDLEPKSELKTDSEERSQTLLPSAPAPMVVAPAKEITSQPAFPNAKGNERLVRPETSEMAPAEIAVGSALSVSPPTTVPPSSSDPLNRVPAANQPASLNPWAIPGAEYPLQYY